MFVINSHTLQISVTVEKAQAIKTALVDEWPRERHSATAREVFRHRRKIVEPNVRRTSRKYFVWRLLRLTGLHLSHSKNRSHLVALGREFHDDLDFWRWAIDEQLLTAGSSLNAPCYAAVKRLPKRLYLSDASLDAIGGYYKELSAFPAGLRRKAMRRETSSVTINPFKLVAMVVPALVTHALVGDRPETKGDPTR